MKENVVGGGTECRDEEVLIGKLDRNRAFVSLHDQVQDESGDIEPQNRDGDAMDITGEVPDDELCVPQKKAARRPNKKA
jgi:hypothetical protein